MHGSLENLMEFEVLSEQRTVGRIIAPHGVRFQYKGTSSYPSASSLLHVTPRCTLRMGRVGRELVSVKGKGLGMMFLT